MQTVRCCVLWTTTVLENLTASKYKEIRYKHRHDSLSIYLGTMWLAISLPRKPCFFDILILSQGTPQPPSFLQKDGGCGVAHGTPFWIVLQHHKAPSLSTYSTKKVHRHMWPGFVKLLFYLYFHGWQKESKLFFKNQYLVWKWTVFISSPFSQAQRAVIWGCHRWGIKLPWECQSPYLREKPSKVLSGTIGGNCCVNGWSILQLDIVRKPQKNRKDEP